MLGEGLGSLGNVEPVLAPGIVEVVKVVTALPLPRQHISTVEGEGGALRWQWGILICVTLVEELCLNLQGGTLYVAANVGLH